MTVRTGNATHCAVTENGQLLAHAVNVEVAERIAKALNGDTPDATREAELKYERLKARVQAVHEDHERCVDENGDLTAGCSLLEDLRELL
jgi:hypothetical protein